MTVHICTILRLPNDLHATADRVALKLNPRNLADPACSPGRFAPQGAMAIRRLWPNGQQITVSFLDGSPDQQRRVRAYFAEWQQYVNLKFVFILNQWNAYVRITFQGEGSASYMGTDVHLVDPPAPTMILGWLSETSDEAEYRRVVLHECGHTIGFEHEDMQPDAAIRWDVPKVLAYYMGPPNNWTEAEVRQQVLDRLPAAGERHTDFDPLSIMAYSVPPEFTLDGRGVPLNGELSARDKIFAAQMYPGA